MVGELERRPQLQTHVLHHHVTAQQEQGLAIDLLQGREEAPSEAGLTTPGSDEKATQGSASEPAVTLKPPCSPHLLSPTIPPP